MSRENVERWRRGVDAWNRGALDEWLAETVTPGWEWITGGAFPGLAPVYRGREGALDLWEALKGPWDNQALYVEIERVEDLGETVLALFTLRASGERSGVEVAIKWAHVITFRAATNTYAATRTGTRPSKPWGWRSRRCRR